MPSFFDFLALIRSFQAIPNATPFLWRFEICPRSGKSTRLRFARPWTEMTRSASSSPLYSAGVPSFVAPRAWTWAQIRRGRIWAQQNNAKYTYTTLALHVPCIFVALNYIAFHYVTLHSIALRYVALHFIRTICICIRTYTMYVHICPGKQAYLWHLFLPLCLCVQNYLQHDWKYQDLL